MRCYQCLNEFESGVIVSAREMECSISEVVMKFGFSRTIFLRVYRESRESDFNAGPSTSFTVRTVQRNIFDMGLRRRRPTRVPLLTARHKALRLDWARQHRHWTNDD
ncbi:HTH_Tnp_Tc3_2 domain-containing protein [Trichonephila clavipes]|uniref:HTH_Tnp_Tc3_2 domain-containing protein n=1 Tax=Trichonephila clavipes TaxID=2585209 RepID=A0A8X6R6B0_TRICX|nr:HTH_Tnp_Tc3_2 domain-containing protein [Trichonephila clavipes]